GRAADNVEERLEIGDELLRLSDELNDRERAFEAHLSRWWSLYELGRSEEAGRESTAIERIAEQLRQPAQLSMVRADLALRALIHGRFAEAEDMIAEAAALGA